MRTSAIAVLAGLIAGCGSAERAAEAPAAEAPGLRVLTYNVNFGLEGDRACIEAIRAASADVVVLQETTPGWEAALREAFGEAYPHVVFRHSSGAGGIAVLSRYPLGPAEVIDAPSGWFPALRVVAETPLGPVQLLALHLRPPVSDRGSVVSGYFTTGPIREAEVTTYLDHLDPALPTVVAGDLNEWDGRAVRALAARGYRSVLPGFHGRQPTWRWQTSLGEVRAQLDHVLVDDRLVARSAEVRGAGRSDHLPLLVELAAAPRR